MPAGRSVSNSPTRVSRRSRSRSPVARRSRTRSPKRREHTGGRGGRAARDVRGKECRVYVSNLNYDVKWMELKDVMKKLGPVEHVEIFTDNTGRSKGTAVVEFSHAEDAARAIKELDGSEVVGREMRLREDKMENDIYAEQLRTQKEKSRNLSMNRGQSSYTGSSGLGPRSGGDGGYGRSSGSSSLGGAGGIGSLLGGGHAQLIQFLNSKDGDPINSSVFVSNLDYDISWQKLKDMLRQAGNCIRCDIAQDDNNRSKGFGSCQFETPFEALTAIAMFNGLELGVRGRQMSVRLDRKSALHQVLEQLGVPSNEVTEKTIQQLQSIATLSALTGAGGLGGLGGVLSQLTALTSGSAYQGLQGGGGGSSALSSLTGLSGLGSALGGLGSLLSGGLGSNLSSLTGASASSNLPSNMSGGNYGSSSNYGSGGGGGGLYGGGAQSSRRDSGGNYNSSRSGGGGSYGNRDEPSAPGCRVFVRNLPFSVNWQALKDKFRDAGRITRADIKTNDDGRSKGCGTVTFEVPEDANRAVSLFNMSRMDGREIEVRIDQMN